MQSWLYSPFFVDDVVDDEFATSVEEQRAGAVPDAGGGAPDDGGGDAGVFALTDGGQVLRFENFDIENGPALFVYVVSGRDRREPEPSSIDLGSLRGNVGDQTYALPRTARPETGRCSPGATRSTSRSAPRR